MSDFTHLFEPIMIGPVEVPNRVCHVPTDISSSHVDGSVSSRDIYHHATIAKGGTGLIIVGATSPQGMTGRSTVACLVADDDSYIPGLARLAETMHRYGAKCAVQLQHPGRQASLPREGKFASTDMVLNLPWSQSRPIAYASEEEGLLKKTIRVLTTDEVLELVDPFAEAAWRIKQAGFDAVELHAAHGYLLSEFMSPYLNRRGDRFGGSFDNRMRFPLAIVDAIHRKCGRDFPVLIRYSVDEWVPGGRELEESVKVAEVFEEAGVAALDLSQCIQESPGAGFDPMYYPEGWTIYASEAIKKKVGIPVINSHTLRNPEYCEAILKEGKTDMVGLSRQLLADPYWPIKAKHGNTRAIRRCISCLTGCWQESLMAKKEIACAINPACGNQDLEIRQPVAEKLDIAVVGGGPAGMEAARHAAERGHRVTVFEKTNELGGAILGCCLVPGKAKMKWYADWIRQEINDLGVDVRLNTVPAANDLFSFDVVVNATGASSFVPKVLGESERVIPFERVLVCPKASCEHHPQDGRKPVKLDGNKVIVWGDHYPAADTAAYLASLGKEITIITPHRQFGSNIEVIHMYVLRKWFQQRDAEALNSKPFKYPVTVLTQAAIVQIGVHEVILLRGQEQEIVPYDHIVTCWVRPNTELLDQLRAQSVPFVNAGDSKKPRNLHAAVREGAWAGLVIEENRFVNPNAVLVNDLPLDMARQLRKR
ncbi:MAG TPA: FAD-dependent oxidoreductase [Atribacteraceae bacterium]|nr:FAD-dependent oxidoreductase [Atribacteraceae bacterium]